MQRLVDIHTNNLVKTGIFQDGDQTEPQIMLIKRPAREACLYMGEASPPDPPAPHFVFAIALIL